MRKVIVAATIVVVIGRSMAVAPPTQQAMMAAPEIQLMPRWRFPRPRFSLLTLLLGVVFVSACGGMWFRWKPWGLDMELDTPKTDFASFSPDGRWIATANRAAEVQIWNANTAQRTCLIKGHLDGVSSAVFSPDSRSLVTASTDGTARLWDPVSGQTLGILTGHTSEIYYASFSPDGQRIVTGSRDGTIRIWDVSTLKAQMSLRADVYQSVVFSSDGHWILAGTICAGPGVWDAESGQRSALPSGRFGSSLCFSRDGERIATWAIDGFETVRIQEVLTGHELAVLKGHSGMVQEVLTGRELAVLKGHSGMVFTASFSHDMRQIVTASGDGTARVWDAETGRELDLLVASEDEIPFATFSPDGQHILMADESITRVFSRRRPEYWWGIAWLPEFWVALLSGGALLVIAARNPRRIGRDSDNGESHAKPPSSQRTS